MSTPSITESRKELKYRLRPERAAAWVAGLAQQLQEHRYSGRGGNRLPRARHYVTTIYFDTPARDLYRAARASDENLKLRAREYYDLHPELTELATHVAELVRYDPVLWIEIKHKSGARTSKRRVGVPKPQVAAFLEGAQGAVELRGVEQAEAAAQQVIDELRTLRAHYAQPLAASCLVNYRRTAWQDPEASLRVTLDQRLCCFAPPADLWTRRTALVRETLGTPAFQESDHILEIKARSELPSWLRDLLERCAAEPTAYSKFATASAAVDGAAHGRHEPAPG